MEWNTANGGEQLDPFLHWLLQLRARQNRQPMWQQTPSEARAPLRDDMLSLRAGFPVGKVEDLWIPAGSNSLLCRHYVPDAESIESGLLVYFHGGGHVIGDLDTHDDVCRLICGCGEFQVLSVDYRLAPEHPFPAAVEDAVAATIWALENAEQFGVAPRRVAVGGDSAGANLATVTAISLAAQGIRLAAQLLLYPPTDYQLERSSRELFSEGLLDGLMLAVRSQVLHDNNLGFDPQFKFDFYDMDFCRQAEIRKIKMGTAAFSVVHESAGRLGTDQWLTEYRKYLDKYGE